MPLSLPRFGTFDTFPRSVEWYKNHNCAPQVQVEAKCLQAFFLYVRLQPEPCIKRYTKGFCFPILRPLLNYFGDNIAVLGKASMLSFPMVNED